MSEPELKRIQEDIDQLRQSCIELRKEFAAWRPRYDSLAAELMDAETVRNRLQTDLDRKYELLRGLLATEDEYRHALEHVRDCDDGCVDCRRLAVTALSQQFKSVWKDDSAFAELLTEHQRFREALEAIAEDDVLAEEGPAFGLFAYRRRRDQARWALGRPLEGAAHVE